MKYIKQQGGTRLNIINFNNMITQEYLETYNAVSSRLEKLSLSSKNSNIGITIAHNKNMNVLMLQLGWIKYSGSEPETDYHIGPNGKNQRSIPFSKIEDDGANSLTYTSIITYSGDPLNGPGTEGINTFYRLEDGVSIRYELAVTITEFNITSSPLGEHFHFFASYGSNDYNFENIYFITVPAPSIPFTPTYFNEACPDIISLVRTMLDEDRKDVSTVLMNIDSNADGYKFGLGRDVLENTTTNDDPFIIRFASGESSCRILAEFDTGITIIANGDNSIESGTPSDNISPYAYYSDGVNLLYWYEIEISKGPNFKENEGIVIKPIYTGNLIQIPIYRALGVLYSNYGHLKATVSEGLYKGDKHNYPSNYNTNNGIHNEMINDFLYTHNRRYISEKASSMLSSKKKTNGENTDCTPTKNKYIFSMFVSPYLNTDLAVVNLTNFKIQFNLL